MGMYLSPRQTGLRTSPELSIRALSSLPQHGATISHTWPNFTNPHNDTTNATSKDVTETKREMRSLLDARPANSSQMVDATCHSERTTPMVMTVKRRERASERVRERERERDTHAERETHRERETHTQRERERERERFRISCDILWVCF